jgi:hypothetical protein
MRTVLCSTRAVRSAGLLVLATGLAAAVALPATSADAATSRKGERAGGHERHAATSQDAGRGEVGLGPAVKYGRSADGTVRKVR